MAQETFHMASSSGGEMDDPEKFKDVMRAMYGPQAVDQQLRQSISTCWMMLPDDRKTPEALESEMRRIFERAISNFKDDMSSFGV